jgi:hypothetical protein
MCHYRTGQCKKCAMSTFLPKETNITHVLFEWKMIQFNLYWIKKAMFIKQVGKLIHFQY